MEGPDGDLSDQYYFSGLKIGLYLFSDEEGTEIVRTRRSAYWPIIGNGDLPRACEIPGGKKENVQAYFYRDYIEFWLDGGEELSIRSARLGAVRELFPPPHPSGGSYKLPQLYVSDEQPFVLHDPVTALPLAFTLLGGVGMYVMTSRRL